MEGSPTSERAVTAIVVAHPGHEVRVHGWLERARPRIFILTDGSGRSGQSRIGATTRYMSRLGVERGGLYGRLTDMEVYRAVLEADFGLFLRLSEELAEEFVAAGVERVVGDAAEGYNTAHDICRLLVDAAASMASKVAGRGVENYDFPVVGRPDHCPRHLRGRAVWFDLDDETFRRKLAAARDFYPELLAEVEDAVHGRGENTLRSFLEREGTAEAATARAGLDTFRVECLRPAGESGYAPAGGAKPFYESHSERQVAAGHYERVIRYREHIAPLAEALRENAERNVRWAYSRS